VIPVLISTIRSLDGYFEALLNHFWVHRLCEVKAPPDGPRLGQQVIDSSAVYVFNSSENCLEMPNAHGERPALWAGPLHHAVRRRRS
jgi:hypothetical protein